MRRKLRLTPFGKRVRKRLIDLEMKQTELAGMLGISPQALSRMLKGERTDRRYREEIIRILGMEKSA